MGYHARADVLRFQAEDHVHERDIKPEILEALNVSKRGRRKSIDVKLNLSDYEPDFEIDCPKCNKYLENDPRFALNIDKLPLTPDEDAKRAKDERDGNVLMRQMADAMARAAADNLRQVRQGNQ